MNTNGHESPVDDALPLDLGFLKVDEQSQPKVGGLKVIDALSHMFVREAVDTLQFDEQTVFSNEVGHVIADTMSFVDDRI